MFSECEIKRMTLDYSSPARFKFVRRRRSHQKKERETKPSYRKGTEYREKAKEQRRKRNSQELKRIPKSATDEVTVSTETCILILYS